MFFHKSKSLETASGSLESKKVSFFGRMTEKISSLVSGNRQSIEEVVSLNDNTSQEPSIVSNTENQPIPDFDDVSQLTILEESTVLEYKNSQSLEADYAMRRNELLDVDSTVYYQEEVTEDYTITLLNANGNKSPRNPLEQIIPNEDKVNSFKTLDGHKVVVVMDGISQSNKSSVFVSLFLDRLKQKFSESHVNTSLELITIINSVLISFNNQGPYKRNQVDILDQSHSSGATCALALQVDANEWIYFSIGDAIVAKQNENGQIQKLNLEQIHSGSVINSFLQPGVEISLEHTDKRNPTQHIDSQNLGTVILEEGESLLLASDGINYIAEEPVEIIRLKRDYSNIPEWRESSASYIKDKANQDAHVFGSLIANAPEAMKEVYSRGMKDNVSYAQVRKQENSENRLITPDLCVSAHEIAALRLDQDVSGVKVRLVMNKDGQIVVQSQTKFADFIDLPDSFNQLLESFKTQVSQFADSRFTQVMLLNKFNNELLNLPIIPVLKSEHEQVESTKDTLINTLKQNLQITNDHLLSENPNIDVFYDELLKCIYSKGFTSKNLSDFLAKSLSPEFLSDKNKLAAIFEFAQLTCDIIFVPDDIAAFAQVSNFEDLLISDNLLNVVLNGDMTESLATFVNNNNLSESFTSAFINISISKFAKLNSSQWGALVVNCSRILNGFDKTVTGSDVNNTIRDLCYILFDANNQVPDSFVVFLNKNFKHFVKRQENIDFLLANTNKLDLEQLHRVCLSASLTEDNKKYVIDRLLVEGSVDPYSCFYKILNKLGFNNLSTENQLSILNLNNIDLTDIENLFANISNYKDPVRALIYKQFLNLDLTCDQDDQEYQTCNELGVNLKWSNETKKIVFILNGEDVTDKYFPRQLLSKVENILRTSNNLDSALINSLLIDVSKVAKLKINEEKVGTQLFSTSLFSRLTSFGSNSSAVVEENPETPQETHKPGFFSNIKSRLKATSEAVFTRKRLAILTPLLMVGGAAAWYMIFKENMPDVDVIRTVLTNNSVATPIGNTTLEVSQVSEQIATSNQNIFELLKFANISVTDMLEVFNQKVSAVLQTPLSVLQTPIANASGVVDSVVQELPLANSGLDVVVDSLVQSFDGTHVELTSNMIDGDVNMIPSLSDIYDNTREGIQMAVSENSNLGGFSAEVVTDKGRLLARNELGELVRSGSRIVGEKSGSMLEFDGTSKLFRVMIDGQEAIIKYFKASNGNYYAGTHLTIVPTGV